MSLSKVLKEINFSPSEEEMNYLKEECEKFVRLLKENVSGAEIFVGGSFAKGTLTKSDDYDIDIFVRFPKKEDLSLELEKGIEKVAKAMRLSYDRLHGSRDYFRISPSAKLTFEIIPVLKIKRVNEAENVTDLSYFHVNYIKKKLSRIKMDDVRLAKQFCKALKVYGAESYVNGFSGYALECLIAYYGSFEKMIRRLSLIKDKEIIDIERWYRKKGDVLIEMNSSKSSSPIVLIDPTWKERNVLAALNNESFEKFQTGCRKLLRNPSAKMFAVNEIDISKFANLAKTQKGEFLNIRLETDRQEGDIAGTKLKKFADFLERELEKYFFVLAREFEYGGEKIGNVYFVVKSKREIIRAGPPLKMKREVKEFRARNRKTFLKRGRIWARSKIDFSGAELVERIGKTNGLEMGISEILLVK